jgi:flagellar motor switch protein FliM
VSGGGQVLSADAIAALVDAAREGRLPEEKEAPQRRRRMRAVDFTRPTKFTSDQERRLKRGLEAFCRTASTRLSAELRVPLELEVINTSQLTWSNAHALVPASSITAVVECAPAGTRLMLSAEAPLVLGAIELLLGGSDLEEVRERRLTDIDWALARHFFDRLTAQLSVIWNDMAQLELSIAQLEAHLETAQMVPVSEPTLTLTIEARLNGVSSTLALMLPWSAIAPVADRFAARDDASAVRGTGEAADVRRAVGRVEMTVRAEVASVELPIEQVLALQPGDVLRLNRPAENGVTLFADKVPVHRGHPGRSGSRRAVQVSERVGRPR